MQVLGQLLLLNSSIMFNIYQTRIIGVINPLSYFNYLGHRLVGYQIMVIQLVKKGHWGDIRQGCFLIYGNWSNHWAKKSPLELNHPTSWDNKHDPNKLNSGGCESSLDNPHDFSITSISSLDHRSFDLWIPSILGSTNPSLGGHQTSHHQPRSLLVKSHSKPICHILIWISRHFSPKKVHWITTYS